MRVSCLAVLAGLVTTPALAQTDYIGDANSGAIITNGDLEELAPALTSNTSFYLGSGGGEISLGGSGQGGGERTLEELQTAGLNGDLVRIRTDIPNALTPDTPFIQIPGFRLRRNESDPSGNGNFAFGGFEGTPLTSGGNAGNTTAYFNNGAASLLSDAIDLGGDAAANTTFSLSFDVGIDGSSGDDIINFTPILRVGDVVVEGGALTITGPNDDAAVVDGSTATFTGTDLTATIAQEFTLPNDIAGDTVSVEISFAEDASRQGAGNPGGGDRGSVDNIVLTGNFIQSTALFGDYNNDQVVDAADYTTWRDAFAAGATDEAAALNGVGNGDGMVDLADYDLWVSQFGQTSTPQTVAVPEPTSLALLTALAGAAACRVRR